MPLPTRNNLFHPFLNASLGFLNYTNTRLREKEKLSDVLEQIDLYYQPVSHPITSSILLIFYISLFFLGEYLHLKVLLVLKKDNGLLKTVSRIFALAQMVMWPVIFILITATSLVHPLASVTGEWFCTATWFLVYYLQFVISSHSLIAASMRYCFIVHTEKVEKYGTQKAKKLFLLLYICIPVFMTFWTANNGNETDLMSFFNKCYGKHHKVFLIDTSTLNVLKRSFCGVQDVLEDSSFYERVVIVLKKLSCIASTTSTLIMGSNLTEGIIYFQLFRYMNR